MLPFDGCQVEGPSEIETSGLRAKVGVALRTDLAVNTLTAVILTLWRDREEPNGNVSSSFRIYVCAVDEQ